MDISRTEQRILHLLAQGGRIEIEKNQKKRIASVKCLTRDGWHYRGVDVDVKSGGLLIRPSTITVYFSWRSRLIVSL